MNALQWWVLAGLMVGGGLAGMVWYLAPARPDLAAAFARLAPTPSVRRPEQTDTSRPELSDRLGLWAMRHLPSRLWASTPEQDLALLGRTVHRLYGEKLLYASLVATAVPLLAWLFAFTFTVPLAGIAIAALVGAGVGWVLPNNNLAEVAKQARLEFNRALGSYVDLVALERNAGGSGTRQALENAAELGDSWPFQRIRDELARSRFSGEAPWDAIHSLADELGLPALDDVADIMRLAGAEGSQVYDTLRARSTALRSALLLAEQAKANALSERMTIPTTLMALVFCAVLVAPAVIRLAAG